jgi:hypothetical protein
MDIFDEELLSLFNSLSKVRYIVIGDIASNLHAQTKFGSLIEIWIESDSKDVSIFLEEIRADYNLNDLSNSTQNFKSVKFNTKTFLTIHILTSVKGLEEYTFDESYQLVSFADILDVKVPFLHINQLIQAKKASNRPKDQIDVMALEKIKKLREEE